MDELSSLPRQSPFFPPEPYAYVIQFTVLPELDAFCERVHDFLLLEEVVHTLLLGILAELADGRRPGPFQGDPVLALAETEEGVQAVGVFVPPRNLVVSRAVTVGAIEALARGLAVRQVALPGVVGPSAEAGVFASAWRGLTPQPVQRVRTMRFCQATAIRPPAVAPRGGIRLAAAADVDLVARWITAFNEEANVEVSSDPGAARRVAEELVAHQGRSLSLWEDADVPVSMAATGGRTPHGARVFAVYTPPRLRRRGYASSCVAAVSQQILDSGRRFCSLFVDAANPTADRIYRDLGYVPVGPFDEYRFVS